MNILIYRNLLLQEVTMGAYFCDMSSSTMSPSRHATCVVASNLRSPEFGCITYAEGEYSIV